VTVRGGGGIAVLWTRGVDVTLHNMSKYHIDMDIREANGVCWRFTGLYEEPQHDMKFKMWYTMRALICQPTEPWLMAGD
jgi:hypothetical protein